MTVALGAAIVLGGALAAATSHRGSSLRAEAAPRAQAEPAGEAAPATETAPPARADQAALSGAVLETLAVSQYTYLRLATPSGQVWAAVPSTTVALGTRVTIANASLMADFKSATLKRTFKEIYFGTLSEAPPPAASVAFSPADVLDDDEQALPAGHPDIGAAAAPGPVNGSDPLPVGHPDLTGQAPHGPAGPSAALPALPPVVIARAAGPGAHTISELGTLRHELNGQRVRVRGQVTKVTPHVQGHTFLHLRDGDARGSEPATDLVVTSSLEPERGRVATFEGTLRENVDIGIGYTYPVLLENATLVGD